MIDVGVYLRGRAPGSKYGRIAIAVYLVLAIASVAWGLSGGTTPDNDLAARVNWDDSEFPTLAVINLSDDDWTGLRVQLDGRYYVVIGTVPRGQSVAVSAAQFLDGFELPRPDGMFGYERTQAREPPPERLLPPGYVPTEVRLVADQGEAITGPSP